MTPEEYEAEKAVLIAMHEYPLKPGQMLWLGPLSVAYLKGDHNKAPWLMPHVKAPGGKRLPDKLVLEREEWEGVNPGASGASDDKRNKAKTRRS